MYPVIITDAGQHVSFEATSVYDNYRCWPACILWGYLSLAPVFVFMLIWFCPSLYFLVKHILDFLYMMPWFSFSPTSGSLGPTGAAGQYWSHVLTVLARKCLVIWSTLNSRSIALPQMWRVAWEPVFLEWLPSWVPDGVSSCCRTNVTMWLCLELSSSPIIIIIMSAANDLDLNIVRYPWN